MRVYRDLNLDQLLSIWRREERRRLASLPTVVFHNAYTPALQHYRWYDDDGGEAASTALAAEDTTYDVNVAAGNVTLHIRVLIEETGGDSGQGNNTTVQLRYNKNGAGETDVTAASSNIQAAGSGSQLTDDGATTNRATDGLTDPAGTFTAGVQEEGNGAFVTQTEIVGGGFTEYVFAITVIAADVADADSITFDITEDGSPVTNNVTPTLTISKPVVVTLVAESGSYSITGMDANLEYHRVLAAGAGSYTLTGSDVTTSISIKLAAESGLYSISGQTAVLLHDRVITADAGSYTINGVDAGLLRGILMTAESGSYSLVGSDASLTTGGEILIPSIYPFWYRRGRR